MDKFYVGGSCVAHTSVWGGMGAGRMIFREVHTMIPEEFSKTLPRGCTCQIISVHE